MKASVLLLCLVLCAASLPAWSAPSVKDVLQIGPDTYLISSSSAFNGTSKKDAIVRVANEFAKSQGKVAVAISLKESRPSVGMGGQFEYQFKLVTPDQERARKSLEECVQKSDVERLQDDLVRLGELREKKILTDGEFEVQKRRLLEKSGVSR